MTAWSFLYDEMYGPEDEQYSYTVTGEKWVSENGGYDWTPLPATSSPDHIVLTTNKSVYKYNEDEILQIVKDYISDTYRAHYNSDNGTQTLDLIESVGDAAAFCRSNILKYASRYDKKGSARMDIKKIIHYAVLLYHFAGLDKETTERGYETF